jgi:hypothetical protein
MLVGGSNTSLSVINRKIRGKISEKIGEREQHCGPTGPKTHTEHSLTFWMANCGQFTAGFHACIM